MPAPTKFQPDPPPRAGFLRRLSYYLMGLAIGLMLLGFFHVAKQHEADQQAERMKALQSLPKPHDDLFPAQPGLSAAPAPAPAAPASGVSAPAPLAK